jgi:Sulfotransferase domain
MPSKKNKSIIHQVLFKGEAQLRLLSSVSRVLPEYLIIGAAKCGTTSLYNYLIQHPAVFASFKKEVHYFDYYFHKGENWFRAHFPKKSEISRREARISQHCITGESSPYYLAHPLSPQRVKALLPNVKMICMLRNPVDRAISSFNNQVRLGIEPLTDFKEAIRLEDTRIQGHEERLRNDPSYSSFEHKYFSYIRRGCYAEQLENWYQHFPKEQIMVIQSEKFYEDPAPYFNEVVNFIGLQPWEPEKYKVFNAGGEYDKMSDALRRKLLDYYQPHNEKLFEIIGQRFDNWDK